MTTVFTVKLPDGSLLSPPLWPTPETVGDLKIRLSDRGYGDPADMVIQYQGEVRSDRFAISKRPKNPEEWYFRLDLPLQEEKKPSPKRPSPKKSPLKVVGQPAGGTPPPPSRRISPLRTKAIVAAAAAAAAAASDLPPPSLLPSSLGKEKKGTKRPSRTEMPPFNPILLEMYPCSEIIKHYATAESIQEYANAQNIDIPKDATVLEICKRLQHAHMDKKKKARAELKERAGPTATTRVITAAEKEVGAALAGATRTSPRKQAAAAATVGGRKKINNAANEDYLIVKLLTGKTVEVPTPNRNSMTGRHVKLYLEEKGYGDADKMKLLTNISDIVLDTDLINETNGGDNPNFFHLLMTSPPLTTTRRTTRTSTRKQSVSSVVAAAAGSGGSGGGGGGRRKKINNAANEDYLIVKLQTGKTVEVPTPNRETFTGGHVKRYLEENGYGDANRMQLLTNTNEIVGNTDLINETEGGDNSNFFQLLTIRPPTTVKSAAAAGGGGITKKTSPSPKKPAAVVASETKDIYVKINGRTEILAVTGDTTIEDIKNEMTGRGFGDSDTMIIGSGGKLREDDFMIKDMPRENEDILHLIYKKKKKTSVATRTRGTAAAAATSSGSEAEEEEGEETDEKGEPTPKRFAPSELSLVPFNWQQEFINIQDEWRIPFAVLDAIPNTPESIYFDPRITELKQMKERVEVVLKRARTRAVPYLFDQIDLYGDLTEFYKQYATTLENQRALPLPASGSPKKTRTASAATAAAEGPTKNVIIKITVGTVEKAEELAIPERQRPDGTRKTKAEQTAELEAFDNLTAVPFSDRLESSARRWRKRWVKVLEEDKGKLEEDINLGTVKLNIMAMKTGTYVRGTPLPRRTLADYELLDVREGKTGNYELVEQGVSEISTAFNSLPDSNLYRWVPQVRSTVTHYKEETVEENTAHDRDAAQVKLMIALHNAWLRTQHLGPAVSTTEVMANPKIAAEVDLLEKLNHIRKEVSLWRSLVWYTDYGRKVIESQAKETSETVAAASHGTKTKATAKYGFGGDVYRGGRGGGGAAAAAAAADEAVNLMDWYENVGAAWEQRFLRRMIPALLQAVQYEDFLLLPI